MPDTGDEFMRPLDEAVPEELREERRDQLMRWADEAMFAAEPSDIEPSVTIISMTPDPLRVIAAACEMYRGRVVRHASQVREDNAMDFLHDMEKTTLTAGLEFVDVHMLIEGVTRAFTHQLVRQRTAVYVQESMRFAVKTNATEEVVYPPSLKALPDDHPWRVNWDMAMRHVANTYKNLVNAGMPAEDARGLLPTNIATRIHYKTNLRNLRTEAGKRLCSQAQFEWKQVWFEIIKAIRDYPRTHAHSSTLDDQWQYDAIASLFKPVCYLTGKCEFMASTDRACSIRDRVEAHHRSGEPPTVWLDINPLEPLMEGAARKTRSG